MCGRYALYGPVSRMRAQFDLSEDAPEFTPRYNAAPMQWLPVVRQYADGTRTSALLRWGLVPSWAKDDKIATRLINARGETLGDKPAFRNAFHKRRCIVPANGFYQWKAVAGGKQPYYIHRTDDKLLALAGLWEHRVDPQSGEIVDSFTIVTVEAEGEMRTVHERAPLILSAQDYGPWLERDRSTDKIEAIIRAGDNESLVVHPVAKAVGNVRNDSPELIRPSG